MTTIDELTIEHLGDVAEIEDLNRFKEVCRLVLPAFDAEEDPEQMAIDYVWNNGSIRWVADSCIYCDCLLTVPQWPLPLPPDPTDSIAWSELAKVHQPGCEWITTRAHQMAEVG